MRVPAPCEIIPALQISKIKTLLMPNLDYDFDFTPDMTIITYLTISFCYPVYLYQLLKYTPLLKYLNIKRVGEKYSNGKKLVYENFEMIYLKELIIKEYEDTLEHLEILLKRITKLKILTLMTNLYQMEMVDADYWQELIINSLPCLDIFNFKFLVFFCENYDYLLYKFQEFQTEFWYKKHHWYNIHEFHDGVAYIYTVPYVWNEYQLILQTAKSSYLSINNLNIFNNVTDLMVQTRAISDDFPYHFSNIKTLKLTNETNYGSDSVDFELTIEHIICLKKMINLSKIKHLNIWRGFRMNSSVLLQLFKETPQLSILLIEKSMLISFLDNNELGEYLNQMINELDISRYSDHANLKSNELDLFCKTFANVKQLECCIEKSDDFLFLINHLSKLTTIKVHYSSRSYSDGVCKWLQEMASKRNINCTIEYR
jgi:hypothetical protein